MPGLTFLANRLVLQDSILDLLLDLLPPHIALKAGATFGFHQDLQLPSYKSVMSFSVFLTAPISQLAH